MNTDAQNKEIRILRYGSVQKRNSRDYFFFEGTNSGHVDGNSENSTSISSNFSANLRRSLPLRRSCRMCKPSQSIRGKSAYSSQRRSPGLRLIIINPQPPTKSLADAPYVAVFSYNATLANLAGNTKKFCLKQR